MSAAVDTEHVSYFPASASCSLTWFIEGFADRGADAAPASAAIVLRGPQTRPVVARHRGRLHMFILLLAPDALCRMTGGGVDRYLNRVFQLDAVLDASWQRMARGVLCASCDQARISRIERFLEPRWQAARSAARLSSWEAARRHAEWSRAAIARAQALTQGRSRRQTERQMRHMTGWSARALMGLARAEDALMMAAASPQSCLNWARIAAETGYADQSHLGRELRRYTGFSPQQLWRRVPHDESLWVYKAWFGWHRANQDRQHPTGPSAFSRATDREESPTARPSAGLPSG